MMNKYNGGDYLANYFGLIKSQVDEFAKMYLADCGYRAVIATTSVGANAILKLPYPEETNKYYKNIGDEHSGDLMGLISRIYLGAGQQACFWVGAGRRLSNFTSSTIASIVYKSLDPIDELKSHISLNAPTLRKERKEILYSISELYEYGEGSGAFNFSDKKPDLNTLNYFNLIYRFAKLDCFTNDRFYKKGFFALYELYRIFDASEKIQNMYPPFWEGFKYLFNELNPPCIDYQIPRILNHFSVIKLPHEIVRKIKSYKSIQMDSDEEIIIRCLGWLGMNDLSESSGQSCLTIDNRIFFNRKNDYYKSSPHHQCLTPYY